MNPSLELLSKTQIIREYGYPSALLDDDIAKGRLKSIAPDTRPGYCSGGRRYIPRLQVENLIRERAGMTIDDDK